MREKNKMNIDKKLIIIAVLVFVLLGAFIYIWYDQAEEQKEKELAIAHQEGFNVGVQQIVKGLMEQGKLCSQIPVTIGNQSITLIAVECLRKQNDG